MGTWFVVLELTYLSLVYTLFYHLIELLFIIDICLITKSLYVSNQ